MIKDDHFAVALDHLITHNHFLPIKKKGQVVGHLPCSYLGCEGNFLRHARAAYALVCAQCDRGTELMSGRIIGEGWRTHDTGVAGV